MSAKVIVIELPSGSSEGIWLRKSWVAKIEARNVIRKRKNIRLSKPMTFRNTTMISFLVTGIAITTRYTRRIWNSVKTV